MKANKNLHLNKRSEIFAKCLHQSKFLAGKFTRAQDKLARKNQNAREHVRTRNQAKSNGQS